MPLEAGNLGVGHGRWGARLAAALGASPVTGRGLVGLPVSPSRGHAQVVASGICLRISSPIQRTKPTTESVCSSRDLFR